MLFCSFSHVSLCVVCTYVYMYIGPIRVGRHVWIREHICGGLTLMVGVLFNYSSLYFLRQGPQTQSPPILVTTASLLSLGDHLSISQILRLQRPQPACLAFAWVLHTKPFMC